MEIFHTILPIILIVVLGYGVAFSKFFSQQECDSLAKFVFSFLIPSLLFIATVKAKIPDTIAWEFLFSFYGVLFFIYALSACLAKLFFRFNTVQISVFAMGASYSNATIIGLPVCMIALGEKSLLPLFLILSIHNLVLFTIGILLAESRYFSYSTLLKNMLYLFKQLLSSPITLSLVVGGLINLLDIQINHSIEQAIKMLSQAAIPAALFVLGTSLNKYKVRGHIAPALLIVVLKIIVFPFFVWLLLFQVFKVDSLWATTALLTSAMPVGISAYIFSQKYYQCVEPIATSIVISTIASIFTLSFLISYLANITI